SDVVEHAGRAIGPLVFDARRVSVAFDRRDIAFECRRVLPASTGVRRRRARANPDPAFVAPIRQVVSTGAAGPGPVRDLVLLVALLRQMLASDRVHLRQVVVYG